MFLRVLILTLVLPLPALADDAPDIQYSPPQVSGHIKDSRIIEASGLARSHVVPDRLWTMNDGGSKPMLFAIGPNGDSHGTIELGDGENKDWEDLASFEDDGKAWLLVADIGDNAAQRRFCTLYIVEEPPEAQGQTVQPARQIRFTYPEGPLDAESVAVDVASNSVFILAKRTVPARLYRVPLFDDSSTDTHIADLLGEIASVPQPGNWDIVSALTRKSWHWQPTAMDFSRDGRTAAILTYVGLYIYQRTDDASWFEALQKTPQSVSLNDLRLAEAVAFGPDDSLFITAEGSSPPLYRAARRTGDRGR